MSERETTPVVRWMVWHPQSANCSIGKTEAMAWKSRVLDMLLLIPDDPEYEGCLRDLKANHGWICSEVRHGQ